MIFIHKLTYIKKPLSRWLIICLEINVLREGWVMEDAADMESWVLQVQVTFLKKSCSWWTSFHFLYISSSRKKFRFRQTWRQIKAHVIFRSVWATRWKLPWPCLFGADYSRELHQRQYLLVDYCFLASRLLKWSFDNSAQQFRYKIHLCQLCSRACEVCSEELDSDRMKVVFLKRPVVRRV